MTVASVASAADSLTPLGTILLQQELISPAQLKAALAQQRTHGTRLGDVLTGQGILSAYSLHRAIAHHYGLPFADLLREPPQAALLDAQDWEEYLALEVLPWRREEGVILLAATDLSDSLAHWAQQRYGTGSFRFVITSPRDIRESVAGAFPAALDTASRLKLWQDMPEKSARTTVLPEQRRGMFLLLALIAIPLLLAPATTTLTAIVTVNLFYLATIIFKLMLFSIGAKRVSMRSGAAQAHAIRRGDQSVAEMDIRHSRPGGGNPGQNERTERAALDPHGSRREDDEFSLLPEDNTLPIYTVLVPLYHEAASLPRLLGDLRALDYPASKLDIKLVIEEDDAETLSAARALQPESSFEILPVPYSLPRTKPKACNYALRFARGEYVTIYDAEDRPDPLQLKKAVAAFRHEPKIDDAYGKNESVLLCLQGRLNYYNRDHSLLTRLFSIEYAAWFDYMLPALERLGIPIPLGGTSNHIALANLKQLGEWDPYNVTEDADLGIRLALAKGRTRVLDSLTLEEAPISLWAWMKQRTRWIKGYMQTWLVHMRAPLTLYRTLGGPAFWGFQFFVGAPCLVFLLSPLFWLLTAYWLAGGAGLGVAALPDWAVVLSVYTFLAGLLAHSYFALQVIRHTGWQKMHRTLLAFPFYWILHSLASFRALWQLIIAPHHWEKTTHGLTPPTT